jgi:hypothetical protein
VVSVDQKCVKVHNDVVFKENEVRRIQRKEEARMAKEKTDAKAAKLAWKVQRRLDRRLFHLQNEIIEKIINKADNDQDIINISDFDGNDADGLKTVGFRGGVIGEFCRLILQLEREGRIPAKYNFDEEEDLLTLFNSVYREFISDGWTFTIGLKPEFEQNVAYALGEFQMGELTVNFIKNQDDDIHAMLVDYIQKHYYSEYEFKLMPELRQLQEMQLKYLRPPADKKSGEDEAKEEEEQKGKPKNEDDEYEED